MIQRLYENLKTIRFEGELLPKWAQLLDLAARLCPVSEQTRGWFSRFTRSSGVDDSQTIKTQTEILKAAIKEHKDSILADLSRTPDDRQPATVFAAWEYTLDTMLQEASCRKTCAWHLEGSEDADEDSHGDGNITLRRV